MSKNRRAQKSKQFVRESDRRFTPRPQPAMDSRPKRNRTRSAQKRSAIQDNS